MDDKRTCVICGKPLTEGYTVPAAGIYYCSPECLREHYLPDEWERAYDAGEGFWTTWHDETEGSVTA